MCMASCISLAWQDAEKGLQRAGDSSIVIGQSYIERHVSRAGQAKRNGVGREAPAPRDPLMTHCWNTVIPPFPERSPLLLHGDGELPGSGRTVMAHLHVIAPRRQLLRDLRIGRFPVIVVLFDQRGGAVGAEQ